MPWFLIVVAVLILLVATPIALWWWRLVARVAPYQDEGRREGDSKAAGGPREVIITPPDGSAPRPTHPTPHGNDR